MKRKSKKREKEADLSFGAKKGIQRAITVLQGGHNLHYEEKIMGYDFQRNTNL